METHLNFEPLLAIDAHESPWFWRIMSYDHKVVPNAMGKVFSQSNLLRLLRIEC